MKCRGCNSTNLFTGIDLGYQPVAGAFVKLNPETPTAINLHPNKMMICVGCGLGQLSTDLDPGDLYSNYNWRTSTSKSYVEYAHKFADQHIIPSISTGEWVLEIASNDGYLLKYLMDNGIDVLGVDPAKNISRYAICDGVPVIADFFNKEIAESIVKIKGHPKWIIANNVMAHTPDIQSFMEGISILSDDNTIVTIENPTIMNILNQDHFDVIFHEHYSYLSAYAVRNLSKMFDLSLFAVDEVPPQGGSNRYWLSKKDSPNSSVSTIIDKEIADGLVDANKWKKTQQRITDKANAFRGKVESIWQSGGTICGVGASAKSTVVLNFANIESNRITSVADDVKEKQGFAIPTAGIPIVSMEEMLNDSPTDIIVFAWNIREELEKKLRSFGYAGNVWVWTDK
jgi:hypothetical protein